MTETTETAGLYDGPCEPGCQHYHGGEIKHTPGCGHYPESLTKVNADRVTALQAEADVLRAEVARLRGDRERLTDALHRISVPEAFYVATASVDPEAFAIMVYAQYVLEGYTNSAASDKAEFETRERYAPKSRPLGGADA